MNRSYYSNSIQSFLQQDEDTVIGILSKNSDNKLEQTHAWQVQIRILKEILKPYDGRVIFEYAIPRMGSRVDVILLIDHVIFVLEFKVGERQHSSGALLQVWDYALDLKNFHEKCEKPLLAPVLVATKAKTVDFHIEWTEFHDNSLKPLCCNSKNLSIVVEKLLSSHYSKIPLDIGGWEDGRYYPTPTIIEKASNLYCANTVDGLVEKSSDFQTFTSTTEAVSQIIERTKHSREKAICFITGVPGAGKTLVGLEIAAKHLNADRRESSVYLSGNGPLVKVLREALALDHVKAERVQKNRITKTEARGKVKLFIQNVHHFRDDCLRLNGPQPEHVAIFDEAQRAWDLKQTVDFMRRKKNQPDFSISEPEFLISCMDRHEDWAVVLCLVGGGQEINTGEAGISEWIKAINRSFDHWKVYISSNLKDIEYDAGNAITNLSIRDNLTTINDLHLAVSMRSFRAEKVSEFVKCLLDLDMEMASEIYSKFYLKYPIVLTRDVGKAKSWLKRMARGSQRYGMVTSSKAQRLKPLAIDVRYEADPIHWFLNPKEDVRSSYYLEDVATEFQIQGLELDWICHVWDADFRYSADGWLHKNFRGTNWININKDILKAYQKNAYRVLLTRARQGMVICVPEGNADDSTRKPEYYDSTFNYLKSIGIKEID